MPIVGSGIKLLNLAVILTDSVIRLAQYVIPRKYGKNARRLCFIFLVAGGGEGGGGVESRPEDGGGGSCKKVLLWPQNGVILVGLDLDSVGCKGLAYV